MVIAVLEDDERRTETMRHLLADSFPTLEAEFFDNAPDLVAWLGGHLAQVALLCLDHDLGPSRLRDGVRFEPGSGRDVADFLASRPPSFPVVVHTSNYQAAPGMLMALEAGAWAVERVVPFDDLAWLGRDWLPLLRGQLRSHLAV